MRKNDNIDGQMSMDELFGTLQPEQSEAPENTTSGMTDRMNRIEALEIDALFWDVGRFVTLWEIVSPGSIMRRFTLGSRRTEVILTQLADAGVINRNFLDTNHDRPRMTEEQFCAYCTENGIRPVGGAV